MVDIVRFMWIKRTEEELATARIYAKRARFRGAILLGVFAFALVLFVRRDYFPDDPPHLASREELQSSASVFIAFTAGVVLFLIFYLSPRSRDVVCTNCGKAKRMDSQMECSCGGHFEDMETIKWKDDA